MKLLVILSSFIILNTAMARFVQTEFENNTLGLIDDICGDSWCEGDFDYNFNSLKCDYKTGICYLSFAFLYIDQSLDDETPSNEYTMKMRFNRSCKLTGVKKNKMISDHNNLENTFYDKVNNCISTKEESVQNLIEKIFNEY